MALRSRSLNSPSAKKQAVLCAVGADSPRRSLLASSSSAHRPTRPTSYGTPRRNAAADRLDLAHRQSAAAKARMAEAAAATHDTELAWRATAVQLPVRPALEEFAPLLGHKSECDGPVASMPVLTAAEALRCAPTEVVARLLDVARSREYPPQSVNASFKVLFRALAGFLEIGNQRWWHVGGGVASVAPHALKQLRLLLAQQVARKAAAAQAEQAAICAIREAEAAAAITARAEAAAAALREVAAALETAVAGVEAMAAATGTKEKDAVLKEDERGQKGGDKKNDIEEEEEIRTAEPTTALAEHAVAVLAMPAHAVVTGHHEGRDEQQAARRCGMCLIM